MNALKLFYTSAFLKSQMFLLPVLYLFYLSNGLTMTDYFLFQGIIVFVNVLLQIPAGMIGDRIPRYYVLICSYVLFLGRIFLWLFFSGPMIVFAGEILYALSKALFDTIESPYLYDILSSQKKERLMVKAYSRLNFALSMGTAIAAVIGSYLYKTCGLTVLLGTEFILVTVAIYLSINLPNISTQHPKSCLSHSLSYHFSFKTSWNILKNESNCSIILYSGILVACSHFFFWSFQPMMKMAMVPVALFGIVMFVNNMMRSCGSLLTQKLMEKISLKKLGKLLLFSNMIAFFTGYLAKSYIFNSPVLCLIFIFYLCCCIMFQLMFTIAHISRLQQISPPAIRTQTAATNMMIARLFAALVLMAPKYLGNFISLIDLYALYGILLFFIGSRFVKQLPTEEEIN